MLNWVTLGSTRKLGRHDDAFKICQIQNLTILWCGLFRGYNYLFSIIHYYLSNNLLIMYTVKNRGLHSHSTQPVLYVVTNEFSSKIHNSTFVGQQLCEFRFTAQLASTQTLKMCFCSSNITYIIFNFQLFQIINLPLLLRYPYTALTSHSSVIIHEWSILPLWDH